MRTECGLVGEAIIGSLVKRPASSRNSDPDWVKKVGPDAWGVRMGLREEGVEFSWIQPGTPEG